MVLAMVILMQPIIVFLGEDDYGMSLLAANETGYRRTMDVLAVGVDAGLIVLQPTGDVVLVR
jgi:hypothetical protein